MYKLSHKIMSWLLVVTLVLSSFPMGEGVKAEGDGKKTNTSSVSENEVAELVAPDSDSDYLPVEDITGDHMVVTEGKESGTYELTAYDDTVKIKNEDGEFVPVDATLEARQDGFSPKSTQLPVSFERALRSGSPFLEVGEDSSRIAFTLKGLQYEEGLVAPKDVQTLIRDNQVWHRNVFPNVDLRHITLNDEVKEDLIFNQSAELPKEIIYEFNTLLTPVLKENQILFYDKDALVLTMPVPEMQDSAIDEKSGLPARSFDVVYELTELADASYELKVVPDQEWLNDPARVYPIYVDPTLARDATLDTFVSSKNPTTNMNKFWSSSRGEYVLWVGYFDATTGTNYGLIKFPALTDLRGATISSADINTYVTWSYYATQQNGLWLDRVNENWSETGVTWNTRPTSTNLATTNVARNQWANFDVTTFVSQVASGTRTDYGFKFHTNGNTTTHWKQITASETNTNRTRLNVTYSYPKMSAISTEGFLTTPTSSSGHVNVTWPAMAGATGYRLQMFDGKGWQTVYTGTARSFTTKDKGLFPKTTQYGTRDASTGGIKFRNGDGQELPVDPSDFFNRSSGTTTNTLSYQFRVIADYKLGSGAASSTAKRSLQELIPDVPTNLSVVAGDTTADDRGQFVLSWDESEHATSYDVYVFNGFAYELIENVKTTSWSPNGKRLFPTTAQINAMPINTRTAFRKGDGQDFPGDPRPLYRKNNPDRTTYHNVLHYYFRVYAKSSKGQSAGSDVRTFNVPAPRVTTEAVGYSDNRKNSTGFLFASWQPVPGAAGYNVYLYNGKEYDLVETVPSDVTTWHSRNKKLWPLAGQSYKLNNNGVVGQGGELPVDPSPNYLLSGGKYGKHTNYWIRVTAHRRAMQPDVLLASNFVSEGNLNRTLPTTPRILKVDEPDLGTEEFYPMLDTSIGSFNVMKENQFLEETDEVLPGRGPAVEASRYFNSKSIRLGMFGLGWSSGLERRLEIPTEDKPKVIRYIDADGSGHLFLRTSVQENGKTVEKLLPPTGIDYEFSIENNGTQYVIQTSDGQREIYNQTGQLVGIEYDAKENGKKNNVRFDYSDVQGVKRLTTIYAASDTGTASPNRLTFTYNAEGWVDTMTATASSDEKVDSRTYRYTYDAWDRLTSVESFRGSTPIETYGYTYTESVGTIEESGEIAERPDSPSPINRLILPGHTAAEPNEIIGEFDNAIPSVVQEVDGTRNAYEKTSGDSAERTVYQVSTVDAKDDQVMTPITYTFDTVGHLVEEVEGDKKTIYEWKDHRIVSVKNPDGSVEKTTYDDRDTADVDKTTELDGNVLVEKDATSITTYEYAENGDDLLRIEDEFGLAEEVALNEDREEIVDHEEPEERIGFTEYDSRGNVTRTGVGLTPGVNLYPNGSFEGTETVTPGTLVDGGRNGKALQLNNATLTREVTIKTGHPYNLGIDMKTSGTSKGSVTLTLLNSSNVAVGTHTIRPMGNLGEWTRRFVEFTAKDGAVKARISIVSENGSTLFDEVQLDTAKQGHAVSASAFNHVEQGGFDGLNKWQLVKATASSTGYMSESGLSLQPDGTAKQTIFVNQSTAKPFYVSALAQKASKTDSLNVVATYEDGTTVQKTATFHALDYTGKDNDTTWQRQTIQLTSDQNKKLVKVDLTIKNGSTSTILIDAVRASIGRVVSESTYDKQGNHVLKDAGLTKLPVTNTVDAFGNVLTIGQGNRTRTNTYDLLGRLTTTTAENGTVISYVYDKKGQVTQKTFDGKVTSYTYGKGRITSVDRPGGQRYQYVYEPHTGNLKETILPSGKRLGNIYDDEGKITELKESNATRFKYGYDATSGDLVSIQMGNDSAKLKKYEYDTKDAGKGRLLKLTDFHQVLQSWDYQDVNGVGTELPLSITLAGTKRDFAYDVAKRNHGVTVESQHWAFRHNEDGKTTQITMPGQGGESLVEFDETGAVSAWSASAGDKQIAFERYSYDQYGNLSGLKKDGETASYSYDAMDQLIEEKTLDGQTVSYAYDKRGNRTHINNQVIAEFDDSNRMTKFKSQAIAYDADGNRINDGRLKYSWDGLGKLTAIEDVNGAKKWQFTYDEQGRRIQKTGPSGTIRFHYDGDSNRLMAETDTAGKPIREYVYNADHILVGLKTNGTWYNYQRNYRGDIVAITDMDGKVVATYTYDTWGKSLTTNITDSKLTGQPIRYASYYYDEELALYYLMARYYHPEQAVFLSVDPLLDSDESIEMANGYSYVMNNPLTRIDPDGLMWDHDRMGYGQVSYRGGGGGSRGTGKSTSSQQNNLYKNEIVNSRTKQITEHRRVIKKRNLDAEMRKFLGQGFVKISNGKWRSKDGKRQFRAKPNDVAGRHGKIGPHVHFEFLNHKREVLKNVHIRLR
ncbi:DNRLRE domain-containing protein [Exiguobacterium alkaliphilum]|uniref:DNRLRE domain-containing protein n=1 Tax=Exiguobacterium alkaliphilum TaxID=1428684 RepID=UPI001BA49DF1|nr:DNRLRE domain-containing protein [Exiguobacterium alkaliphilum]QUE88008.1 DNRLRE domain-containing protein [Exiguobacterium alkaliphilum]